LLIGYDQAAQGRGNQQLSASLKKVIDHFIDADTAEPNRVVFLKTKHGLPLFALSVTNGDMRTSYYRYVKGWRQGDTSYKPIHVDQLG